MYSLELFYPLKTVCVYQAFGMNPDKYEWLHLAGHNGVDFVAYHGEPVRAAHDGIVTYVGTDNNEGWGVVIRTEHQRYDQWGFPCYWKTLYWHLASPTCHEGQHDIPVHVGQKVRVGDIIGYADNTGWSTGDHLHFGLKPIAQNEADDTWFNPEQKNGYLGAVDPAPYFKGTSAEDAGKGFSIVEWTKSILAAIAPNIALFRKQPEDIRTMIFRVCKEEGLSDDLTNQLYATICCESEFNPKAKRLNDNGTTDYGLCQFNDYWYIGPGKPIPSVEVALNDPEFCVRVMARQFKNGRAHDWICYRNLFEKADT